MVHLIIRRTLEVDFRKKHFFSFVGPSDVYVPIKGDKAHGVIRINGEQWNRK